MIWRGFLDHKSRQHTPHRDIPHSTVEGGCACEGGGGGGGEGDGMGGVLGGPVCVISSQGTAPFRMV